MNLIARPRIFTEQYEEFSNQLKPCDSEHIGVGTKFKWHD
jgi:hypothetical protein